MDEPNELVREYLIARAAMDKAQAQLEEAAARLRKQMESDQRKSFRWEKDGIRRSISYVQQYTINVDEPGLRRALRAKTYDRYTKRVLDRRAMEKAMDSGEVDPVVVSRFTSRIAKKPFLTYSEKEAE
jgi:hypothetical protein